MFRAESGTFWFPYILFQEDVISISRWNGLGTSLEVRLTQETSSAKENHFNIEWNTFPPYRWEDTVKFNSRLMHWLFRLDELEICAIPPLSFDSLPSMSIVSSYEKEVKKSREKMIHHPSGLSEISTYIILVLCAAWIVALHTGESFSQLRILLAPRIISCPARDTHLRRRSHLLTCSDGDKHTQFHRLDCFTTGKAIESRAANTVIMGHFSITVTFNTRRYLNMEWFILPFVSPLWMDLVFRLFSRHENNTVDSCIYVSLVYITIYYTRKLSLTYPSHID